MSDALEPAGALARGVECSKAPEADCWVAHSLAEERLAGACSAACLIARRLPEAGCWGGRWLRQVAAAVSFALGIVREQPAGLRSLHAPPRVAVNCVSRIAPELHRARLVALEGGGVSYGSYCPLVGCPCRRPVAL